MTLTFKQNSTLCSSRSTTGVSAKKLPLRKLGELKVNVRKRAASVCDMGTCGNLALSSCGVGGLGKRLKLAP